MNWEPGQIPSENTMAFLFGQGKWTKDEQLEICQKEIEWYSHHIRLLQLAPEDPIKCLSQANTALTWASLLAFFHCHKKRLT